LSQQEILAIDALKNSSITPEQLQQSVSNACLSVNDSENTTNLAMHEIISAFERCVEETD
jgi:hypothetical protein